MYGYNTFHEKLMQNLIDSIRNNTVSHAYIFEGEKGMYKRESARLFAAALTCESSSNAPCGMCKSCIESAANTNPDIMYIKKPEDKEKVQITIEAIRKVTEDVIIKPFSSPRKVYIIEDGDLLNEKAQNALLKTFEEPPEYAVFIIIAENADLLLPTIRSRAITIKFNQVHNSLIEKMINEKYPDQKENIPWILNVCEGNPGVAESIIDNPEYTEIRNTAIEMLNPLLSSNKNDIFAIESYIDKNKDIAKDIFDMWISFFRDILVLDCYAFDNVINVDKQSELRKYTGLCSAKKTVKVIEILSEGRRHIYDNVARIKVKAGAVALSCAIQIKNII